MPRFAGDAIAPSKLGQVLAIAERLDTLAGGFAAGLKPTGAKDPFALRRNALGMARTIIESGTEVDLLELLLEAGMQIRRSTEASNARKAVELLEKLDAKGVDAKSASVAAIPDDPSGLAVELQDFIFDRLKSYYGEQDVPATHFHAVAELRMGSLLDFDRRLKAIGEFARLPEAEALAAANKRIRNILRKVEGELPSAIDPALFAEDAERELATAVDVAIADTNPLLADRDYVAALGCLARLRPQVDAFFDQVMVNVDDPSIRNNRLALLKRLGDRLGSVAAIEHLSV